jgi:ribosomal protein L31E
MGTEVFNPVCRSRHGEVSRVVIPRQLANQISNKLQVIVCFIEEDKKKAAINAVQELARFLNRQVDTEEEEGRN